MIVSGSSLFKWENDILDKSYKNNIKCLNFIKGIDIILKNMIFEGLSNVLLINSGVNNALIDNCTFSDCQTGIDFIIDIRNEKCSFINNYIVFSEYLVTKGRALSITSNGDIKITNNKFKNCCSNQHNQPTIYFNPPTVDLLPDTIVQFNCNYIESISIYNISLFSINCINQNVIFDHNIISRCNNTKSKGEDYFMCEIKNINSEEFTLKNLTVNQCISGAPYGGSLSILFTAYNDNYDNKKLTFIKCKFNDNKQIYSLGKSEGGGGVFEANSPSSNAQFEVLFDGCTFDGNSAATNGGALSLTTSKVFTISNCIFTHNKALGQANGMFLTGCGGAIYLKTNEMQSCIIESCSFENNYDSNGNGNAIYILNDINKESINSVVEILPNCVFQNNYNSNSLHQNYAIHTSSPVFSISGSTISASNGEFQISGINFVGPNSENNVFNATFDKCNNNKENGARSLAIDIHYETKQVTIEFSRFNFCGDQNTGNNKYTIYDQGKYSTIHNCTFTSGQFDQDKINAPSINVRSYGTHIIINCYIINPVCTNYGSVSYLSNYFTENDDIVGEQNENFVFQHNIIENVQGDECIAMNIIIISDTSVDMSNNTIQKCTESKRCLISIYFSEQVSEFNFDKFTFKDNLVNTTHGGGAGIFVKHPSIINCITFTDCLFIGNHAEGSNDLNHQGSGGGLHFCDTTDFHYSILTITNCSFENNFADKYGGGLMIEPENSFICENCYFIGNKATELGGAIYIEQSLSQKFADTTITGCTFKDNDSTGSSIYFTENKDSNSHVHITGNCQFKTNKKNDLTHIIVRCKSIIISDITFNMENLDKTCRAIKIESTSKNPQIINSTFKYCNIEGNEGNAIYIESLSGGQFYQNTSATIEGCLFENCGTFGWAVYSLENRLEYIRNIVTYTSNAKNQGGGGLYAVGGRIEKNTFENTFKYGSEKGNALTVVYNGLYSLYYPFYFNHNVFINSNGEIVRCFDITISNLDESYSDFQNNTVKNCPESSALTGIIDIIHPLSNYIIFSKCNWINNSIFGNIGGGSGLSIKTPSFFNVFFENNCIFENNTSIDGKGGALQIGKDDEPAKFVLYVKHSTFRNNTASCGGAIYLHEMDEIRDLNIENCTFKNNKSTQHGGAILLQDIYSLNIKDCLFEENSAYNCYLSSTKNKLHYEKKEGRGGGVFISLSLSDKMNKLIIEKSTFKMNSAYDGYGIYIEGNERGESIIIKDNKFIDNYKTEEENSTDIYSIYRSVISSEIFYLYEDKVNIENSFINSDSELSNKLYYVDHYGNPINESIPPTNSIDASVPPTNPIYVSISPTNHFTISSKFTEKNQFSSSFEFTGSHQFSFDQQLNNKISQYIGISCGVISIILLIIEIIIIVIKKIDVNENYDKFDDENVKDIKTERENKQNNNFNEENIDMNIISNDSFLEIYI